MQSKFEGHIPNLIVDEELVFGVFITIRERQVEFGDT